MGDELNKREVAAAVAQYRDRGMDPREHASLRPRVRNAYGEPAAEFFDQECSLPLRTRIAYGLYPWPLRQDKAWVFEAALGVSSVCAALSLAFTLANVLDLFGALLTAGALLVVLVVGIPSTMRLFPPRDLGERKRLVRVFESIKSQNQFQ